MNYLKDIVDPTRFADFVARGLITSRAHEDNPQLRVFSYGKRVQFEGIWTPETRLARGLMLNFETPDDFESATIVGRGIPKFFTVEQAGDDWSATKLVDDDENVTVDEHPVIPWDAPAHVANKLNGALGLGYINPKGNLAIATKGSFGSIEAIVGSRLMLEKTVSNMEVLKAFIASGNTPLFEIITPERPHPINYGNLEDLIYLGFVSNKDGVLFPADDSHIFTQAGFTRAETMPYQTLREAVTAPYEFNTEGMVVSINEDSTQHLFKVKPKEYLTLRRMFYAVRETDLKKILQNMTGKEIFDIQSATDVSLGDAEAMLMEAHEELATAHKQTIYAQILVIKKTVDKVKSIFDSLRLNYPDYNADWRKDMSILIKGSDYDSETKVLLFAILSDTLGDTYSVYVKAMKDYLNK